VSAKNLWKRFECAQRLLDAASNAIQLRADLAKLQKANEEFDATHVALDFKKGVKKSQEKQDGLVPLFFFRRFLRSRSGSDRQAETGDGDRQ